MVFSWGSWLVRIIALDSPKRGGSEGPKNNLLRLTLVVGTFETDLTHKETTSENWEGSGLGFIKGPAQKPYLDPQPIHKKGRSPTTILGVFDPFLSWSFEASGRLSEVAFGWCSGRAFIASPTRRRKHLRAGGSENGQWREPMTEGRKHGEGHGDSCPNLSQCSYLLFFFFFLSAQQVLSVCFLPASDGNATSIDCMSVPLRNIGSLGPSLHKSLRRP